MAAAAQSAEERALGSHARQGLGVVEFCAERLEAWIDLATFNADGGLDQCRDVLAWDIARGQIQVSRLNDIDAHWREQPA